MDINNNQQINTFTKGMDTDTSDMYMGEGSYRYAENLRVVTDEDSNSGELHIIEGTNKLFDITLNKGEKLLGYTSIRNYIITIVKDNENKWAIFRYNADNNFRKPDNELNKELVAGWFSEKIWPTKEEEVDGETVVVDDWDGKTKQLSLVTRWEADDNVKLYIANGTTELLSINVAPKHEYNHDETFEEVFRTTKINLHPISAKVSKRSGARIPGVVLQYGYVLYKVNGPASTLSILSNVVTLQIDSTHGYKADELGGHPVDLTMPQDALNKYIRIYRVAYSKAGQLPRVDVIYDLKCGSLSVIDSGQSLYNLSSAEFVATNTLLFVPNEIESKGDYLFAGNIKYSQDEIDKQFEKFDARCYSYGNYYWENQQKKFIRNEAPDTLLSSLDKNIDLHHTQFDDSSVFFDAAKWQKNSNGYNGHGLCFDWKYVYDENDLYFTEQYGKDSNNNYIAAPKTYARNEVYRFGVRLFDSNGNGSSVKWIADIKMPGYFADELYVDTKDYIEDYTDEVDQDGIAKCEKKVKVNNISIEFTPRNIDKECWNGVARYEIVQAKRSITDSFKITLGIVGYPMAMEENERCLPYFLTINSFKIESGIKNADDKWYGVGEFGLDKKHLIFCSPEYVYQSDDVLSILKSNTVRYQEISHFTRKAGNYGKNGDVVLGYRTGSSINQNLTQNPIDLRIQSYVDTSSHDIRYKLTLYIMGNTDPDTWRYNHGRSGISYGPIGGIYSEYAHKDVFFTNMYAQLGPLKANNDLLITGITFNDAQENNLAKDEWPTYRSQFKILPNGDKFYNWTNPAFMRKWMYDKFTAGGTETDEGWKDCTMSSREEFRIGIKYAWYAPTIYSAYDDVHALEASSSLMFPVSTGGPNMILEFNNPVDSWLSDLGNQDMPAITVANIYLTPTPYGGYNINSINSTQYISQGFYSSPQDGPLKVSMGDNVISMFIYCLYHAIDHAQHNDVTTAAIQYIVPIESTIDISKQCSDYVQAISSDQSDIHNIGDHGVGVWVQAKPSTVASRFTQTTDMYMYNTAYSVAPDIITYAGQDTVNQADPIYDSRIHYSLKKLNNELIDNWTSFKAIDYLDVDSRYGQITGLKLFKDKLIFLQENGAGVLSVNDRIILKDQESANIIVGNGGVLDRYDYFTTIYGMKPNQHVVEASNDALYWWDGYRKEIIAYTDGYNVNLLLRIKNVANYINKGTESDTPSIVYDANNKEVLFNVVNDKCIIYNEQIQQFTSVYTFNPIYYSNIDGKIYLTDQWNSKEHLYEYNKYDADDPKLFEEKHHPMLKYVVNREPTYNKVFDIQTFGGRFYKGYLGDIQLDYYTPLKQHSQIRNGKGITDREYDYRLAIPRNNDDIYGGRMRGKTMECVLTSSSNDKDFSIQYITTKYRMSWT